MAKKSKGKDSLTNLFIGLIVGFFFGIFGPIIMIAVKLLGIIKCGWLSVFSSVIGAAAGILLMRNIMRRQASRMAEFARTTGSASDNWIFRYMDSGKFS